MRALGGAKANKTSPCDAVVGVGPPTVGNIHGTGNNNHAQSDEQGYDVSFEETPSNTTLNIGKAALQQPPINNGWGQRRPASADLEQGGEARTTRTIERSVPQRENDAQGEPIRNPNQNFGLLRG